MLENYKVVVTETVTAFVKVNALSKEEALDKVEDMLKAEFLSHLKQKSIIDIEDYLEIVDD